MYEPLHLLPRKRNASGAQLGLDLCRLQREQDPSRYPVADTALPGAEPHLLTDKMVPVLPSKVPHPPNAGLPYSHANCAQLLSPWTHGCLLRVG